jgi:hypothetical protein
LFFTSVITSVSTHSRNGKDGHQERLLMVQIHDEYTMSVTHGEIYDEYASASVELLWKPKNGMLPIITPRTPVGIKMPTM